MFTLRFYDHKGKELKEGDIVKVLSGRELNSFYAEVKYLEKEQALAPFHTFSFHKFEKVDKVPEGAVRSSEERYNIWYMPDSLAEKGEYDPRSKYLMDWRACEHELKQKCFRITKD